MATERHLRGRGAVDIDLADFVLVENGAVQEKHSYVDGVAMRAAPAPTGAAS